MNFTNKKTFFTVIVLVFTFVGYAQNIANLKELKYIVTAPDGSVCMTVTDHEQADRLELESINNFYRFEVIDRETGEILLSAKNEGKSCSIDKNKLGAGLYNLQLYTSNFIVTSELNITPTIAMRKALTSQETSVAISS